MIQQTRQAIAVNMSEYGEKETAIFVTGGLWCGPKDPRLLESVVLGCALPVCDLRLTQSRWHGGGRAVSLMNKTLRVSSCQQPGLIAFLACILWSSKPPRWGGEGDRDLRAVFGRKPSGRWGVQSSSRGGTEFCQRPFRLGKRPFPSRVFRWGLNFHRHLYAASWEAPRERTQSVTLIPDPRHVLCINRHLKQYWEQTNKYMYFNEYPDQ